MKMRLVPSEATVEMIGAWWRRKNGWHFADDPAPTDVSDYAAYADLTCAAPHAGKVSRDSLHRVAEVLFNIYEDLPADAEYGKGLMRHLDSEHDGDCIKQPYTCGRCLAEKYEGYARAVLEAIGLEVEG